MRSAFCCHPDRVHSNNEPTQHRDSRKAKKDTKFWKDECETFKRLFIQSIFVSFNSYYKSMLPVEASNIVYETLVGLQNEHNNRKCTENEIIDYHSVSTIQIKIVYNNTFIRLDLIKYLLTSIP